MFLKDIRVIMVLLFLIIVTDCGGGEDNSDEVDLFSKIDLNVGEKSQTVSYGWTMLSPGGEGFGPEIDSTSRANQVVPKEDDLVIRLDSGLWGFQIATGIERETVINFANESTTIGASISVNISEQASGVVGGEAPASASYYVENTAPFLSMGKMLIHRFEPERTPGPTETEVETYQYSLELKNLVLLKQSESGDMTFPDTITIDYASMCRLRIKCIASGDDSFLLGSWAVYKIEGIPDSVGGPTAVDATNSTWVFNKDGTYGWFFKFNQSDYDFDLASSGEFYLNGNELYAEGMSTVITAEDTIPIIFMRDKDNNVIGFEFADEDGDKWFYQKQ